MFHLQLCFVYLLCDHKMMHNFSPFLLHCKCHCAHLWFWHYSVIHIQSNVHFHSHQWHRSKFKNSDMTMTEHDTLQCFKHTRKQKRGTTQPSMSHMRTKNPFMCRSQSQKNIQHWPCDPIVCFQCAKRERKDTNPYFESVIVLFSHLSSSCYHAKVIKKTTLKKGNFLPEFQMILDHFLAWQYKPFQAKWPRPSHW